jgi:hypothetical protein
MDPILQIAEAPLENNRIPVEHDGVTYYISGYRDANVIGRSVLMEEEAKTGLVRHLTAVAGVKFEASILPQVVMVSEMLENPDGKRGAYDISVIAKIAARQAPLFMKLAKAAAEVCGFAAATPTSADGMVEEFIKDTAGKSLVEPVDSRG